MTSLLLKLSTGLPPHGDLAGRPLCREGGGLAPAGSQLAVHHVRGVHASSCGLFVAATRCVIARLVTTTVWLCLSCSAPCSHACEDLIGKGAGGEALTLSVNFPM